MKILKLLIFAMVVFLTSCFPKGITNYNGVDPAHTSGLSTIELVNDTNQDVAFVMADSLITVAPNKKLKTKIPYGYYYFNLNDIEFYQKFFGRYKYQIIASENLPTDTL